MPPRRARIVPLAVALLIAACLTACDRDAFEPVETGQQQQVDEPPLRVVTLAPALTKMMVDLDRANTLVGVGEYDAAAPPGLPVLGTYNNVNSEKLLSLNPTHVLMMAGKEGAPERLKELATAQRFTLVAYPYPTTITEVGQILFNEEELMVGPAQPLAPDLGTVLGANNLARNLKYRMLMHLATIDRLTPDERLPKVLLVIGTDPITASGPGSVNDELLRIAGGRNAAADATTSAPTFDREKLLAVAPDVILLLMPDAPPLGGEDDPRLASLYGLDIPAVRSRRIVLLNDPLILLPASNLAQVAGAFAAAIHPDLAARIELALATDPTLQAPVAAPDTAAATAPAATTPTSDTPDATDAAATGPATQRVDGH